MRRFTASLPYFCFYLLIVVLLFVSESADGVGCRGDDPYYDEYSQHSDAHISEVINELKGLEI